MNGQGESPDCDFVIRAHKLCLDLNDIIMLINSGHDTEEILHKVVEESSKVLGCESARIALREDENWVIRYVRNLPDDIIGRSFTDEDLPHAALAMISRKPVAIDDAFHDDRTNTEMMKSLGMKSILVLPLLKKDVVIGTLFYGYSSRTVSFTDVEIDYAERIATGVALALQDASLHKNFIEFKRLSDDAREYAENIVETVREPLVVLNSDLKILTANHSFYDTFKVTPEETIGNFIYDLGNRQWDIPGLRVLIEEILPQDTVFNGYEVEHDFVDIGHKVILLNARQIFRENIGSHIILLAMEDITERKQLEAEIQDAREYAENIVETVREPLVVLNSDLKVLTANHSFYDTFKVSPENTIGNFIYDLGNRQWDIPKLRVLIEEILPQDTVFNGYEVEHNFADIGHKVILLNARQIFRENIGSHIILLAMEDITERKQLEEALRKSADEMEESKNLGDALNEIDTLLYSSLITTQDYNATIQRMLEMTTQAIGAETAVYFSREGDRWRVRHVYKLSGSLVGRSFSSSEVLHTAITAETKRSIVVSDALHSQDVDQEFVRMLGIRSLLDFPLIIKGEVLGDLAFHYHSSAVPFNERQVEFVRKLQNSITLALENARLLDTIQEVNRELETFNYTVAHDLRKPLAVINGYCQMIMTYSSDMLDEKSKGYLQKAYDGTWRMTGLIDALLNFSRVIRGELNRESVNLSAMAKEVVEELQLVEPERRTTIRITEGIKANGDASLLQIVLENIIGNAWKYTSEQEEAIIEFGVTTVGEETAYFVRDNGPGFDMADAEKLFLPFQRLEEKPEFAGHGIGLATVERIIKRHGGRVWSEGALGKGATFYFTV